MKLYLSFPECEKYQLHKLDRMTDLQLFELMTKDGKVFSSVEAKDIFQLHNTDLFNGKYLFYEIDIPHLDYIEYICKSRQKYLEEVVPQR